jgi:uncharacterized protein (DUF433 family)
MAMSKEYVEWRGTGLYVVGTRVSLASVVFHFRQGASPETIFQKFPALSSLENIYGAIAFYLANGDAVNAYLAEQDERWKELQHSADPFPGGITKQLESAGGPAPRS